VQTPSRTEQVQEVRVTKAEAPTTQPLVNVADVQRQFVPLHEAAATTVTPRMREEVFDTIYKEVSAIKHTPTSVNVTLSPESMGTVTVKVGVEEGKMTARIDVQNVEVKHIIESNMPKLQDVLQSNGVSLDTVGVFVNTGSSFADKRQEAAKRKTGGAAVRIDDGFEPLNTVRDAKQYGYNTVEYIM
jgi:flagellar hook-length control protein FliK